MEEDDGAVTLYGSGNSITDVKKQTPSFSLKAGLAQMLRGGAIFEVNSPTQAKIAEDAGATCLLVSDPGPAGALRRMPNADFVREIKRAVSIPVMGQIRAGHFVEAQVMEALGVEYIDESEVIGVADEDNFVNKHNFRVPFVCGCNDLGEALRRVREGAAMLRAQGEGVSDSVSETVRSVRAVMGAVRVLNNMDDDEVFAFAKRIAAPYDLVSQTKQMGRLPVVLFAAGGIATPADAALMMQLGCDGVFVGSEVFEGADPYKKIRRFMQAVRHYNDPHVLVECSVELEDAMAGINLTGDRIEQ